jgi:DNA repair exonuclease SbcCD ATPase subunit
MKIINLKAENVKKIKAIDITPTDNTIVISGKNGQGKSSVLDSILFALGGKDALKNTPKPVRDGQEDARIEIDLGDYKVIRTFTEKGTTRLEVLSKEGAKFASPQTLLDEIVGRIAFDPLAFANMKPAEQRSILLDVLGLAKDVEALQNAYRSKYELRTFVGRELKTAQGHAASTSIPENAPKAPVDTVAVANELREAEQNNRLIEDGEAFLETGKKELARMEAEIKRHKAELKEAEAKLKKYKKVDTTKLEERLASAGEMNRRYEQAKECVEAQEKANAKAVEQQQLTDEMNALLKQKDELITSAKLPIDGLNIDAEGVTFNAMPFTQLSSAEQLKISLAIAMSMNPKLRVMRIMDGSLLDSDNMAVIKEMAKTEDYQVWIERVEDNGQVGILIEDGQIKK